MIKTNLVCSVGRATVLLMALLAAANAQIPLLDVSQSISGPKGWTVTLTNNYSAPATAYALRIGATMPGRSGPLLGLHWADAIPNAHPERIMINPGASLALRLGAAGASSTTYTVAAVIYADGATAGDPALLAHLLKVRRLAAAELPGIIARLQAVTSDPGTDRAALVADFNGRDQTQRAVLEDHIIAPIDPVTTSALATLQDTSQSLQLEAAALGHEFSGWYQQLQSSRPSITP